MISGIEMASPIGYRIFYVWLRNAVSHRRFIMPTFIASIGEPLLYLVAIGLGLGSFLGLIDGKPYIAFLAPGLVVSAVMYSTAFECTYSSMVRMTIERVYSSQLVTPVSVEEVVAGEILWGMTRGVFSGIMMLAVLAAFGLARGPWILAYPLLWLLVSFLFASLSMLVTAFAKNFDFFTYYFQLFISPMFFFSGIFFPLDRFPPWVLAFSQLLPLTHAVNLSRCIASGDIGAVALKSALALLLPAVACFIGALALMKRRLVK